MPATQEALKLLQKALPALGKQLPKLLPLLLEPRTRAKLMGILRDLASASPKRKLAARMEATELLAQQLSDEAEDEPERQRANEWRSRARKMRARLDMPVEGVRARREHRAALHDDMAALHKEMGEALRE